MEHQTEYIGEGLVDHSALDLLNGEEVDHRQLLDSLAIDVGEKYLDDIYSDDGSGTDSGCDSCDEPGPEHVTLSIWQHSALPIKEHEAPMKPDEPDSGRLSLIVEEEADSWKQRGKEMAYMKVRQLLIEEEAKVAVRKKSYPRPVEHVPTRRVRVDGYDSVRLLDSLAQAGREDIAIPDVKYPSRTYVSGVGDRISQSNAALPPRSKSNQRSDVSENQLSLLAMLGQISLACRVTELSDTCIARLSSHLISILEIMREDTGNLKKEDRTRRLSSTQATNESSDFDFRCRDGKELVTNTPMFTYPRAQVAVTVRGSFKAFSSAQDLSDTLAAFKTLLVDCRLDGVKMTEPWHLYYHIRRAVYNKLGFRKKQLFKLLDTRFNVNLYKQKPASNKNVCIIGAGPVGLRAAVELALLGSHVSVLEKRTRFSRENMLHLWPWVVQDMAALGAKILFPKFCKSRTYFHVSTRQLQLILLKVALLVGVEVYTATNFEAIVPPQLDESTSISSYTIKTEPQITETKFAAVLGASGTNDALAEPAGIKRFVFCEKESLGIVCYFPNLETTEETKVKEFSWTAQLKHKMLNKMRETGIDLENIVYFRGEMHYLVMTPKRHNLVVRRVVKKNHPRPADLVRADNINSDAFHVFVNEIVSFVGIPRKTDFARVSIFDFSSLTRAEKAANILTSHGKKLYVGLLGDSLLEPVWHEGVGTCRGFLSALDAVWMIAQIGKLSDEQLLADREFTYRIMQRLSGHHRSEMQKNVRKYTVDPKSRYTINFPCAA
ncbi:unnamed protein product [Phytophthora fragariaefolia]|uniref:Unnamed protein product n=1 Tax=Phytophthora fragariaefolia TaxID=1490495 RepID=A0A9W6TUX8_9STRA|nr:unnamed protein product [Phytophthora fragariaefolia]